MEITYHGLNASLNGLLVVDLRTEHADRHVGTRGDRKAERTVETLVLGGIVVTESNL